MLYLQVQQIPLHLQPPKKLWILIFGYLQLQQENLAMETWLFNSSEFRGNQNKHPDQSNTIINCINHLILQHFQLRSFHIYHPLVINPNTTTDQWNTSCSLPLGQLSHLQLLHNGCQCERYLELHGYLIQVSYYKTFNESILNHSNCW